MKCPVCDHEGPVADFGDPLRCPDCGAFYEKAVLAKAKMDAAAHAASAPAAPPKGSSVKKNPSAPRKKTSFFTWFVLAVIMVFALKACFGNSPSKNVSSHPAAMNPPAAPNHLAPIESGAIPDRIGCDEGCDRLNQFEQWQPYLSKVVEVHRRQEKCKKVVYVGVSHESPVSNPTFFVMCENEKGQSYNTEYTKAEVEAGQVARGDDVTQRYALERCNKELPRYFPGYFEGAVTKRGFSVAANGRARVTYDLRIAGIERLANCLVGHDFVEFTVVK